jgi:hypothetical protein
MDRNFGGGEFPSLDERVYRARAERSIAIGSAIGEALAALWRVVSRLPFSPSARKRVPLRSVRTATPR